MNLRLTLSLMTLPAVVGSILTLGLLNQPVAAYAVPQASCDLSSDSLLKSSVLHHHQQGAIVASAGTWSEDAMLDFTEAESDAAVALFGCDCSACINALRQLQSQPLLDSGNGHCWTAMQRRVSPQMVQEILQNLDDQERAN